MKVLVVSGSHWAVRSREPVAPEPFEWEGRGDGFLSFLWHQDEILDLASAHVAQLVERVLGKDEVISSTLIMGSRMRQIVKDNRELRCRM